MNFELRDISKVESIAIKAHLELYISYGHKVIT